MNKAFIYSIALILFLAACSHTRSINRSTKIFQGNWQLQTIVSEGISGNVTLQLFNESEFQCFIGSQWHFNKDYSGSYVISATSGATSCAAVNRIIRWNLYASKDDQMLFQFKRLDNNGKDVDSNSAGAIFIVTQLNERNIKLRSDIIYDGKPAALIYNFVKI